MADEDALFADFMGEIKSVVASSSVEEKSDVAAVVDKEDAVREVRSNQPDTTKRKGNSEVSRETLAIF